MLAPLALMLQLAQQPQAQSLLNQPLYATGVKGDEREKTERDLSDAVAALAKDPKDTDAALKQAAALRALGRLGDALEAMTRNLEVKPDDRLYRARGLAYIVYRKFNVATRDLRQALTTIPDAACDVGLSEYLDAHYADSDHAYASCPTPDLFARLAAQRAKPHPSLAGVSSSDGLASAYLAALQPLLAGSRKDADKKLKQVVEKFRDQWKAPAYIAAEADYARLLKAEGKRLPSDNGKKKKKD